MYVIEKVDCKRWNTSWSNSSIHFFNKQIHLPFSKKQIVRNETFPDQILLTIVSTNKFIYFSQQHVHWLVFSRNNSFTFIEKQSVRDKAVPYQSHQMIVAISTFILLYLKTDCNGWNSSLPTPLAIYFDKRVISRLAETTAIPCNVH